MQRSVDAECRGAEHDSFERDGRPERFLHHANKVAFTKERVLLERHGKPIAALVPVEDLELLQELEDRLDLAAARKALKEPGAARGQR